MRARLFITFGVCFVSLLAAQEQPNRTGMVHFAGGTFTMGTDPERIDELMG